MKQMIIMLSMIILGIVLAGLILSFGQTAEGLADTTQTQITDVLKLKAN